MRTSLGLSVLLVLATGACSQSLTPDMTGAGSGSGAGGKVGPPGTGGSGGSSTGMGGYGANEGSLCDTLTAEYQSALTSAASCQVGASGQCQQLVDPNVSGCSCPIYVTDSSALTTIDEAWQAADCQPVSPPCAAGCPAALNTTCVSTDGGSAGVCSYVPGTGGISGTGGNGATGGTTGAGGSSLPPDAGLDACGTLASEYAAALTGAKSCGPNQGVQCATQVPVSLSPCGGCVDYVNDSSALDAIRQQWEAAGCADVKVLCPLIDCAQPRGSMCTSTDAGGSICISAF